MKGRINMKSKIKEVRFVGGIIPNGIHESFVITMKNEVVLDMHFDFTNDLLICDILTSKIHNVNVMNKSYSASAFIKRDSSVFDIYYAILSFLYKLGIEKPNDEIDNELYNKSVEYRNYINKNNLVREN